MPRETWGITECSRTMIRFILFLKKIYVPLLFILLEALALNFYANSTSYTKARLLGISNAVVGRIYKQFASVGDYFGLRRENEALVSEVARLQNELEAFRMQTGGAQPTDSLLALTGEAAKYYYTTAYVINNSITRQENYITLDKGRRDGVEPNMAIVTPQGTIVGYVLNCSDRFSVGISVLNINFKTGGNIRGKDNFGSLYWDGLDHNYVVLSEIPKYADLQPGDTIVTGYSSIFPPDVEIGCVESFELTSSNYYKVKVKLSTRMSSLKRVLLVRYADAVEQRLLEEQTINGGFAEDYSN